MATGGASQSSKGFSSGGKVTDRPSRGSGQRPPEKPPAVSVTSPTPTSQPVAPETAFAHNPEDTGTGDSLKLNFQFQPNILDNFDVYTYHWKLFIVDPASASNGEILDSKNQTIIVESGVTDLTIDKVDIRGVTVPSIESGTGVATEVKFEIIEPSGAGLIDQIFYQSIGLGIGNWAVMPIYLQLQFRGRDPDTSESLVDGASGNLASLKWIWALKLTDIKANVTTVGTKYDFTAIPYNELAQSNAYFVMKNSTSLRNLRKVSDALAELQDKLNTDQLLKLIDNYSIPDVFRIIVDPAIADENLYDFSSNRTSSRSGSFTAMDRKDATFGPGTAVDKIIDTILGHTSKFQKAMTGSDNPGSEGQPSAAKPSQMKKMWRIITETRPLQFDPRRMDDAREFTIFVVEYNIGVLDSNVFQEPSGSGSLEDQRRRLAAYLKKSILRKKYNYIFTGLNDQIINFDLTLNNAYSVAQSRMGGIYSNLAMSSQGVAYQNNAKVEADITSKLRSAISFMNTAEPDIHNAKEFKDQQESVTAAINASSLPDDTKKRYITLLENAKPENKANFLQTVAYGIQTSDETKLNVVRKNVVNLATPQTEKITNRQLTFISDVNTNLKDPKNTATLNAYTEFLKNAKGKLRPIAHLEQLQDNQFIGMESNSNSGIQKLSSIFSVALHGSIDATFTRIKLTIKGDPFWMSPQPFFGTERPFYNVLKKPADAISWIKDAHFRGANGTANYYGTDNFLIIRFRTPRIYNTEEGESDANAQMFNEVATFSGVYKVVRVSNNFASGKFTQELECIIDPFINILNFSDDIDAAIKAGDVPTIASNLISTNTGIPATAVKQDKLATPPSVAASDANKGKGAVSEGATATTLGPRLSNDQKIAKVEGNKLIDAAKGKK